uniref:Histone-lysine N-methyltransferase SUVR3 n=1 Tax=Kalanchoe fedtschenkoi TaxID=63787 RepID=A0A7N1A9L3_KALFE
MRPPLSSIPRTGGARGGCIHLQTTKQHRPRRNQSSIFRRVKRIREALYPLFEHDAFHRQAWGLPEPSFGVGLGRIGEEGVIFEFGSGCDCESCGEECPCDLGFEDFGVVNECGRGCGCGMECGNRVSQRGINLRLKIVKDGRKGWGLYAAELIQCGQFVCEYAGELLNTNEARRRQAMYDQHSKNGQPSSALLVVREHLPSGKACLRINIDATRIGNVGRFINHSCDGGNLSTVIIRSSGTLLPHLCFFASTDIEEGDELMFSYGTISLRSNGLECFCGSSSCSGERFIPWFKHKDQMVGGKASVVGGGRWLMFSSRIKQRHVVSMAVTILRHLTLPSPTPAMSSWLIHLVVVVYVTQCLIARGRESFRMMMLLEGCLPQPLIRHARIASSYGGNVPLGASLDLTLVQTRVLLDFPAAAADEQHVFSNVAASLFLQLFFLK